MGLVWGPYPGCSSEYLEKWLEEHSFSKPKESRMGKLWKFIKFVVGMLIWPFVDPVMKLRLELETLRRETAEARQEKAKYEKEMLQTTMNRLDVYLTSLEIPYEKKEEWDLRARVEFLLTNASNKIMYPTMYKIKEVGLLAAQDMLKEQLEDVKANYRDLLEENGGLENEIRVLRTMVPKEKSNG